MGYSSHRSVSGNLSIISHFSGSLGGRVSGGGLEALGGSARAHSWVTSLLYTQGTRATSKPHSLYSLQFIAQKCFVVVGWLTVFSNLVPLDQAEILHTPQSALLASGMLSVAVTIRRAAILSDAVGMPVAQRGDYNSPWVSESSMNRATKTRPAGPHKLGSIHFFLVQDFICWFLSLKRIEGFNKLLGGDRWCVS